MKKFIALAFVFASLWFGMPAHALAQTLTPLQQTIDQEQVVVMPTRNEKTLVFVDTLTIRNLAHHAVTFQLPAIGGSSQRSILLAKGIKAQADAQGFLMTLPPGVGDFSYTGRLPFSDQASTITLVEPLAIRVFSVSIPEGALAISAQGGFETVSSTFQASSQTFRRFFKLDIAPNYAWQLSMTLLPTAGGHQASPLPGLTILDSYNANTADAEAMANVVLILAILVIGFISIERAGRNQSRRRRDHRQHVDAQKQKEAWMHELVQLEMAFRQGACEEERYVVESSALKEKLIDLTLSLQVEKS